MDANPRSSGRRTFGIFDLDLRTGELRKRGARVRLQQQPFQVLAMLVEHPGEVIGREDLQRALWPENTFVDFDHGLNKAINKIRQALGDSADAPRFVETVARRGYRFLADVAVDAPAARRGVHLDPVATGTDAALATSVLTTPGHAAGGSRQAVRAATQPGSRRSMLGWGVSTVLAVAVIAGLLWARQPRAPLSPAIRSLAVLPLESLSSDGSQEYFADGMTDELIATLGQISALRVISRTSMMAYKHTRKSLPEIARELNVDAVVEGTVLRFGDQVRITAQLIDGDVGPAPVVTDAIRGRCAIR